MKITYKIVNKKNNTSPVAGIDINTAHLLYILYDPSIYTVEEERVKFKGPFCMHCHSNEHLGIDCPERDALADVDVFAW